ncbi:hypothetical protein [Bacillus sp. Marseille-P3800]|uniref:hypothetical protein n=1 Tax=Bacillus sp. Marseille-P3800 TaxID=2014782 RepID=UPI000C079A1A|nr:hypothetical protein [Bacillus sp. Marseille-P3800]
MDHNFLSEIATSPFIFSILFVAGLALAVRYLLRKEKEQKDREEKQEILNEKRQEQILAVHKEAVADANRREQESNEREKQLRSQLGESNKIQKEISETLADVKDGVTKVGTHVEKLEQRMDVFETRYPQNPNINIHNIPANAGE